MPLSPGARLGPYVLQSLVGAGGMGEVYRSRDAALHRDVAIKVLPEILAHDPDRLARFAREAQTLAALSHPNIAHIYGLIDAPVEGGAQVHALVMEWVDGEDLAHRLARGPIPVDEALAIAKQLAEALESAHEQGIIHRDIKPANIKVKSDGMVKVLDFGLAKAADPALASSGADPLASPTMTSPALTAMGIILGTAAYMSPEQARGKPVDRRADIWAFGVVLTEMLTGRHAFKGETVSDVMVSVLSGPIDLTGLPANVPRRVREVIARCLERDPKRRLRDIGEARVALESASEEGSTSGVRSVVSGDATVTTPARRKRMVLPWIIAALSLAAAAITGTLWFRGLNAPRAAERLMLEIGPPDGEKFVVQSNAGAAVISPDGSMVAFLAQGPAARRLYVRSLVTGEARAISGSEEASYPFWSPDSRSLAFFGSSKLLTVSIAGGLPEAVADIQQGRGGTWTDNGVILFTPRGGGVVHRVVAGGGAVETVTALDASRGENAHYWPVALPGGRDFLFFVRSTRPENNGIYVGSVDGKTPPVRLVTSLSSGLYAPSRDGAPGHVLWVRDGELLAQPLDIEGRRLTGDVRTIASDVRVEESQRGNFASVATNGTIVWASAKAADLELAWFSRDGRKLETLPIPPGKVMQPRISPDGRKLAFTRAGRGTADIWLLDFQAAATTQLTTDPGYDETPSWSLDGNALVYNGSVGQDSGMVIATIDGSRAPRVAVSGGVFRSEAQFLPNRPSLLVSRATDRGTNLTIARLDDAADTSDLTTEPGYVGQASPSPDGQWLALVTDRTGRYEVVLSRLVEDGPRLRLNAQRLPVSPAGGIDPHWRADGREIIYLAPDRTLMAVSVTINGNAVSLGKPARLFRIPADAGGSGSNWTASADHTRFVVVDNPHGSTETFRVLTNWQGRAAR
jgi:Tol biopolymer transport system component